MGNPGKAAERQEPTAEELEDQEDCEESKRILNDPDDEVVEWEQAKDEIHRWRKKNGYEVDEETPRTAAGSS